MLRMTQFQVVVGVERVGWMGFKREAAAGVLAAPGDFEYLLAARQLLDLGHLRQLLLRIFNIFSGDQFDFLADEDECLLVG